MSLSQWGSMMGRLYFAHFSTPIQGTSWSPNARTCHDKVGRHILNGNKKSTSWTIVSATTVNEDKRDSATGQESADVVRSWALGHRAPE